MRNPEFPGNPVPQEKEAPKDGIEKTLAEISDVLPSDDDFANITFEGQAVENTDMPSLSAEAKKIMNDYSGLNADEQLKEWNAAIESAPKDGDRITHANNSLRTKFTPANIH